jgi:hypothetical protein
MVMLPPPGLAITSPEIDATILEMQKSGPSKAVFWKFSYKRLVLCSVADLLEYADKRNQAVKGVKFLHFSNSLVCSNRFSFLLYLVKGFFGVSACCFLPSSSE